jgi:xanthine dehydrogenase accessory factor
MMTFDQVIQLRQAIERSLRAGGRAVVATLVARDGHSYRDPGAVMAMDESLQLVGGVSGGCLEEYIGRVGRNLLGNRSSVLMSFDTADETPSAPTLGCGGRLEILVEWATPLHIEYLDALANSMLASDRAAVILRFDSNGAFPSVEGCRAVLIKGIAKFGDALDAQPLAEESVALRQTITRRSSDSHLTAAYLWPQPRLLIFGARDDAMPLSQIAHSASWHVTVVDRRARLATVERFPHADAVICDEWAPAIHRIDPTAWTAAVAMTHSFDDDAALIRLLTQTPCEYIGVLGPTSRTARLWEGVEPEAIERIHSPIGLSLGEKSPQAIAIAVMAELIACRRGRNLRSIRVASNSPTGRQAVS